MKWKKWPCTGGHEVVEQDKNLNGIFKEWLLP